MLLNTRFIIYSGFSFSTFTSSTTSFVTSVEIAAVSSDFGTTLAAQYTT